MRRASKVDGNQKDIVEALRKEGYTVSTTHQIGKGFPDIIVGTTHKSGLKFNYLFELKDPIQKKSDRKLTPDEVKFHSEWKGQIHIIHSVEEALQIIRQ